MTDRGTAATYRRIGDRDRAEEGTPPAPSGLRRISDSTGTGTGTAETTAPATPAPADRGDEWSVPELEQLESPTGGDADRASGDATTATDVKVRRRLPARTRAATVPADGRDGAGSKAAGVGPARGSRLAVVALSVVAVLLAAAVVVLGVMLANRSNTDSLRASALSAARTDGVLLSSYDYRNLTGPGSDWAKVEAASTPSFRKNFLSTSADLGKLLTQYNATATGKVLTAGMASLTGSRAVVLLFIDQTVDNTVQKGQSTTQPLRSQLTLVRQGGRWLIDDLQVPK
jgi:Mce-associated membrane protein